MPQRLARALLWAAVAYVGGALAGGAIVLMLSSNGFDREQEAGTTGAFVVGPIAALAGAAWGATRTGSRESGGGRLNPSVAAVGAGILVAAVLGVAAGRLLFPFLLRSGVVDLQQMGGRLIYLFGGALPAVAGGYVAARLAPRAPLEHSLVVGAALIVPVLFSLPMVLRAYAQVRQSPVPLILTIVLRPAGAALGAWATGRVAAAAATAGTSTQASGEDGG